jgi:rsbT co-antagonist protein RsbR
LAITDESQSLASLFAGRESDILASWISTLNVGEIRMTRQEAESQGRAVLDALAKAVAHGSSSDMRGAEYADVRDVLQVFSRTRALQGFSPTETATFVLSLKRPLFEQVRTRTKPEHALDLVSSVSELIDRLALFSVETYQKTREELIARQGKEIEELSTPVVKLWDGIVALPLIGTLDSGRTQVVMQNLLETIVQTGAEIAILDITGVPMVDTLTAQHLLKTVSAARLMGADCIISGIRPQIAQTIVQLGVDLNVVSKATLADALALALRRTGRVVTKVKTHSSAASQEQPAETRG